MRRLVCIALLLAGCNGGNLTSKDVELTINVQAVVTDADVASVRSLDIAALGATPSVMSYPLSRPLARSERIVVHFPTANGTVNISVLARDAQSGVVMRGVTGNVDLAAASGPHPASLTMVPPANGTHAPSGIDVKPPSFTLFTGQTLPLAVGGTETVTWSAGDGGTIDATGHFTAPSTAGTYHATATSTIYPTDHADVTLNVLSSGIALFAGTLGGAGTVDGNGSQARINAANGMILDGTTLYFTDMGQTLRRFDTQTGDVTTIAGQPDYSLEVDGTGNQAGFQGPAGLAWDGNNTFWVADVGCPCIRKVTKAGVVTTLAGARGMYGTMDGTGAAAQFRFPVGLAYDAGTNLLYVTDQFANTIRSVDPTSGAVVTIAGVADMAGAVDGPAAMAKFNNPSNLAFDGGALWIFDWASSKLRKLDLGSKVVSTVATSFSISSLAVAGSGKLVLGNPLRMFDEGTSAITDIIGENKQRVYEWSPEIAASPDGSTIWMGALQRIIKYDVVGGTRTAVAGFDYRWDETAGSRAVALLGGLSAVAVRADGTVFARDNRILRFEPDGTVTSLAGGTAGPLIQGDGGMAFGSDGMLYAADHNRNVIVRIDVDHGAAISTFVGKEGVPGSADGTGTGATFNGPEELAIDGNKMYVADQNNHVIRVVDMPSGAVTTLAGGVGQCGYLDMPGTMARFCGPFGIAADGMGNLYVADNNAIRKIVIAGAGVTSFVVGNGLGFIDGPSGTAKLWGPQRVAFDAQKKYLYFSDAGNDAVRRVEMATATVSTVAGGPGKPQLVEGAAFPGSINQPGSLHFAANGDLLVVVPRENALAQIRLP